MADGGEGGQEGAQWHIAHGVFGAGALDDFQQLALKWQKPAGFVLGQLRAKPDDFPG